MAKALFMVLFSSISFPNGDPLEKGATISRDDLLKRYPEGEGEAGIDRLVKLDAIFEDPYAVASEDESEADAKRPLSLDEPGMFETFSVKELTVFAKAEGLDPIPTKKAELVAALIALAG